MEKEYNAKVIDADKIARTLSSDPNSEYFKAMTNLFGEDCLEESGLLNRKKVASIIFADNKKRNELNKLTFKYVAEEMAKKVAGYKEEGASIIAIDVPLLYEAKMEDTCNYVIAVVAADEEKISRICKRDGIKPEVARKRLEIQNSNSFFIQKADFVINNDKSFDNLENSLKEIMNKIWENGFQE